MMEKQKEKEILFELCDKGEVWFLHEGYLVSVSIALGNVHEYSSWKLSELYEGGEPHDGGVCNGTPLDAIRMSIE